jgi:two-component system, cell cycle response regulator DivK
MSALEPSLARILVVEDDPDNRIVITRLLRMAGVDPLSYAAIEGDAAAYLAAELSAGAPPFDLVFLDLQLPKKDGYAMLREIRSDPSLAPLRVVALTANVSRRELERCRDSGFDGFIGKPIDGRRFSELLRRILGGEGVWTED